MPACSTLTRPTVDSCAAAYISAGVAARQLSIPTYGLDDAIRDQEQQAQTLIKDPPAVFDPEKHTLNRITCEFSYHPRLAFARKWVRSKDQPYLLGAIHILEALRQEYPHVLEIEDELALAYLEAGHPADFERLRTGVERRYNLLSEEFLSRVGRFWKRKADEIRVSEPQSGRELYQKALTWYQQAYAIRRNYYPGINVAGLQFVLGQVDASRQTAQEVLASLEVVQPSVEEMPWVYATKADALLIFERNDESEAVYRRAVALADPHGRGSMRRQVELLVQTPLPIRRCRASGPVRDLMGSSVPDPDRIGSFLPPECPPCPSEISTSSTF